MIIDLDSLKENQLFITDSDEVDDSKIKMKPAEFSRLIGVSKQAVSAWIRDGKISIGVDGYLNPNKAIGQLLKNANPAKLRSKALMPLIKQVKILTLINKQNDIEIAELKEEVEFLDGANDGFLKTTHAIRSRLEAEADNLKNLNSEKVIKAFLLWLDAYIQNQNDDLTIIQFTHVAPVVNEEGAGVNLEGWNL